MHILVIGAAGMIGRKLVDHLTQAGELGGRRIENMTLYDVVEPQAPTGATFGFQTYASDISTLGEASKLIAARPDIIFHLAAVV
jgi:D-erythronate 2-dehydrogenase